MTGFKALLRLQLLSRFADLKPKNLKRNGIVARAPTQLGEPIDFAILSRSLQTT